MDAITKDNIERDKQTEKKSHLQGFCYNPVKCMWLQSTVWFCSFKFRKISLRMTLVTTSHTCAQQGSAFPPSYLSHVGPQLPVHLITLVLNSLLICMEMEGLKDVVPRSQCQISNHIIKIKNQFDKPSFPAENTVFIIVVIFVNYF